MMLRALLFVGATSVLSGHVVVVLVPLLARIEQTGASLLPLLLVFLLCVLALAGPTIGQSLAMRWWFPREPRAFDDDDAIYGYLPPHFWGIGMRWSALNLVVELHRAPRSMFLLLYGGAVMVASMVGIVALLSSM